MLDTLSRLAGHRNESCTRDSHGGPAPNGPGVLSKASEVDPSTFYNNSSRSLLRFAAIVLYAETESEVPRARYFALLQGLNWGRVFSQ